jgi:hypothetical protein
LVNTQPIIIRGALEVEQKINLFILKTATAIIKISV